MNKQRRFITGIFLIILTMFFISGILIAQQQQNSNQQPKPSNKEKANKMVVELSKIISLSRDQIANILDLFQAHINEVNAAVDKNQNQRENREEMDRLRKEFEGNVNALLSDKQKAGFDKFMKSRGLQPNKQQGPKL